MPNMELRSTFTTCFLLLLIFSALPHFSKGGSEALSSEIYEIDYRGPETHSSVPPPHRSHANPHPTHRKTSLPPLKAKPFVATDYKQQQVKKIHG